MDIVAVALDHPDAVMLTELVQAEYVVRYGGQDRNPLDPAAFAPPAGAFFVGYVDGRPVGMGGWRRHPGLSALGRSVAAEIRRMYVTTDTRRTGLARRILARLEESARTAGADLMVLETGTAQPEAIALYETSGYLPVEPFGFYAGSRQARHLGKPL